MMLFCVLQDVAQSCEIKCMPTFHFYKNGKKVCCVVFPLVELIIVTYQLYKVKDMSL